MTVYRITSDNNIIRVSDRRPIVKIINNGRGVKGEKGDKGDTGEIPTDYVVSVVAGTNVTVDNTDPYNPIVSAEGAEAPVTSVNGRTGDVTGLAEQTYVDMIEEELFQDIQTGDASTLASANSYTDSGLALKVSKSGDTMSGDLNIGNNDITDIRTTQFNLTGGVTPQAGQLSWNATEGVLDMGTAFPNVTIQLGMENIVRARNNTGSTIANGKVVYVNGALGNRPTIALADADISATARSVLGVATADIANNADGAITTEGLVRDLNTNAYAEGTELFLSQTPGELTNIPPTTPALRVKIATVTRSHVTQGEILVHTDYIVQKADIGLGNVDNTSDLNKPVSTATQTALDGKANFPLVNTSVPIRTSTGVQSSLPYTAGVTANTIVSRDMNGNISAATPTANAHLTTKLYVDTSLGNYVLKTGDNMTGLLSSTFNGSVGFQQTRGSVTTQWGTDGSGRFAIVRNGSVITSFDAVGFTIGNQNATHSFTLPSTATGIALYLTTDQTTNYERLLINSTASIHTIISQSNGTGTARNISIGGVTSRVVIQPNAVFLPVQAATASAPTYVKGGIYFDTTLNKLRVGGATTWETVTST